MHKKIVKVVIFLFMMIYIVSLNTIVALGAPIDPLEVIGSGPNPTGSGAGVSTLYELGNIILGILQYIAGGIAIIATLVLAIRYMYSSPDQKAEVKKKLIPFIIGGVLVYGAVQLVKIVEMFTLEIV